METQTSKRPSEIRQAFAIAKAKALKNSTVKIIQFVNAEDHTSRVSSSVPLTKPLFEPSMSAVWIDEYTPYDTHTTKLSFRNCDSVARRMKIESPFSPFFKIVPYHKNNSKITAAESARIDGKVAAGMEITFVLEFSPQEIEDYAIDLICCTEREKFVIPVRARGRYPALDIPDEIHFGVCPVKRTTSRVLTVRNVGTRTGKFSFTTSDPQVFQISPESATLEQGGIIQLEVSFLPPTLSYTEGHVIITDDSGQVCQVQLLGKVENVDVYLSQPIIEPAAAYITLSSRKSLKIVNESEHTLDFAWKAFADSFQEDAERQRLLEELAKMESAEMEQLLSDLAGESQETQKQAHKAVRDKYKHLKKAVLDDPMLFVNDCFALTPLTGRVWAHSQVEVVTSFAPTTAALYACAAYLEIGGQATRLGLQIRGQGIGPKAKILYNERLDFGDVFINDERTRDFSIQNRGEIPATYELAPLPTRAGVSFEISPSRGVLDLNEIVKIEITFKSNALGEVAESIRFRLVGSEEQLCVRFKANVIPPVFYFDTEQLDFGSVSYSFLHTKPLKLVNTSKISMQYALRIPEETSLKKKEFEIQPVGGKLEPYGSQDIQIRFTPFNVKAYDYRLVVAVEGVGSDMLSIPIKAIAMVPEVFVQRPELDFGQCFLRHPHKETLTLVNKSNHLSARFQICEQDDHSKAIAAYTPSMVSGTIKPQEKLELQVSFSCEKLGHIRLPMSVSIAGSSEMPLPVTLMAQGTGPKVEIDQTELNWGNCTCLVDHKRVLTLKNTSLIPAYYKTFIRNARSKFQIDSKEGMLAPGETTQLVLVANLDDTIVFKDQLHILITEGENLLIPLSIKGIGTTMWSQSELRVIDFHHQMTNKECEWSCTLENKGKRAQVLTWVNKTAQTAKLKALDQSKAKPKSKTITTKQKDAAGTELVEEVLPVFSVFPSTIELKPRTACVFVFKGLSLTPGLIQEELICETRVGKEKNVKTAFATEIRGHFINPRLVPSLPMLSFSYVHSPKSEIHPQTTPLSLRNDCELPLSFTLRTQAPFSLDCWEASLAPGEKLDLNVEFYPGFKDDFMSRILNGKILVTYTGHPQKDAIELVGDISFPNLEFESSTIDFGCTLNDTQKSMLVKVKNISKMDTCFRWVFIEENGGKKALPINQVFDILPIRGRLKPGEVETIEFIYYGHANRKFKTLVACEVDGGPEYELTLMGEASSLCYKLDKQFLDFGPIVFNKAEDREFSILNTGKVPFSFTIGIETSSEARLVEISPSAGKVLPNDKQKIIVRMRPGIPEKIQEKLIVEIAHFQPIEFKLFATGIFASIGMNLPREEHPSCSVEGQAPKWKELLKQARATLEQEAEAAKSQHVAFVSETHPIGSTSRPTSRAAATPTSRGTTAGANSPTKTSRNEALTAPGRGATAPATAPTIGFDESDVEIEACRLFFSKFLLSQDPKKDLFGEEDDARDTPVEPAKGPTNNQKLISTSENNPTKSKTVDSFPFVLSNYVLDFGNVIVGSHKIRKFSITNIGQVPASFQFDKNLASAKGFQIEPQRVVRLPEKQKVDFAVTFQARKTGPHGLHQVQLPIEMKNGPPCLITIRATVTVPDVTISHETLEFGKTTIGTSHVIYTQLHNPTSVSAEWTVMKPMGSARDLSFFKLSPNAGVLPPGGKTNVQVEFIPEDNRLYNIKLPIKVTSNSKTRTLSLSGQGEELRISFNPAVLELGPLLPCSGAIEKTIEMRNESEYPVEVFSLDFDDEYKREEELLRSLDSYGADDMLRLTLRAPGQTFREYLSTNNLLPADVSTEVDGEAAVAAADSNSTSDDGVVDPATSQQADLVYPTVDALKAKRKAAVDYLFLGPPRSGKSTQAKLLAEKACCAVWTIEQAIHEVATEQTSLGATVRRLFGLEKESAVIDPEPIENNVDQQKMVVSAENNSEDAEVQSEGLRVDLLEQILCWRLGQLDMRNGSVLDGLDNAWFSFEDSLKALARVINGVRVVLLKFDEETYETMISIVKAAKELVAKETLPALPAQGENPSETANEDPQTNNQSSSNETLDRPATDDPGTSETPPQETKPIFAVEKELTEAALSFAEYTETLQKRRPLVQALVAGVLVAQGQDPHDEDQLQLHTKPSSSAEYLSRNNFVLEYQVTNVGPPLILHGALYSAIEKMARDIEITCLKVAPSVRHQLVRRPSSRFARKAVSRFSIHEASLESDAEAGRSPERKARWVIPANASVQVAVRFASSDVGSFDSTIGFEIVGMRREFNLFCRGICTVPSINSDPRNVFMSRIKSRPEGVFVHKKYVLSKSVFEFGPLTVDPPGKLPITAEETLAYMNTKPSHCEVFRISNASKYAIRIDFCLEKTPDSTFFVHPSSLDLPEGETGEVRVLANPIATGLQENALLCCVSENPEPVSFALSCYGSTPTLSLRGPWERTSNLSSSAESTPILDFERLLLSRQDEKSFEIENTCAIPIVWKLLDNNLPSDFKISQTQGTLKPFQRCSVAVTFTANAEIVYNHTVQIEYSDLQTNPSEGGNTTKKRSLSLVLQAEAYKIDVCSFEMENSSAALKASDGNLDYGLVRVGEKHVKTFSIRNRGKYDIKYVMSLRSAASRENFVIEPMELVLGPDKVASISVTFQSKNEVALKDCKDIKCTIYEMITGEPYSDFYVLTSVRSVFSLFRILPNKGINFGPQKYNEPPRTKRFEIRNDGEFAFKFRVRSSSSSSEPSVFTLDTPINPGTLRLGQFSISPDAGTIDPGTTLAVNIVYQPKDCEVHREVLEIDVSGRNTSDAQALQYELIGESCYPGITTTDYDSIFEEQAVVRCISPDSSSPSNYLHGIVFAEKERVFSFGAMIATASTKGAVERFKISNPTKVTTSVHFSVQSIESGTGTKDKDEESASAFTIQPSVWEIPPLEHRFVNVHFKPVAIKSYRAVFIAKVEENPQKETSSRLLQFEMRGEGTMPCMTVADPTQRDTSGALLLNFGRVRVSKSKQLPLVLRNDGILSATVLFSLPSSSNFHFSHANSSLVLSPHSTETLSIQFKPGKPQDEPVTVSLKITVQNNPFDETTIKLSGVGFKDDVTFEDLPRGLDDELHFDDVVLHPAVTSEVSTPQVKVFSLCNQTSEVIKFTWPKDGTPFSFSPALGHILPRSHKLIKASFYPPQEPKASVFKNHRVVLSTQRIIYKDPEQSMAINWDENISTVSYESKESATDQTHVEPAFDSVPNSTAAINLNCSVAADVLDYECSAKSISFKPTFMLQVCTHKISMKNKSKIKLDYAWKFEKMSEFASSADVEDEDCPFEITPEKGTISAEEVETFVVKFAPMEVDEYQYLLTFEALNAPATLTGEESRRFCIEVRGSALRPACHFDLECSDYAQRRAPHLVGPNGELGPLDPSVKVVEMESLGIRVRNTRRFYVVNPTNVSYEFMWVPEGEVNACFRCATPKGLMLAGRRCEMIFEFTPQHLDLQEMFWRFKIPQFQVDQLFLFVGKTSEPRVALEKGSINFNTLLIGSKTSQSVALLNHEHIPFNFVFDKASLDFAGESPVLSVHPLSGVIPPNSRCPVEIEFVPTEEKTYNFNLNCIIKRKPTRLALNVKGEGYTIHDALSITSDDHTDIGTVVHGHLNLLSFGATRVNEEVVRHVVIQNTGKFNFDFNWGNCKHPAISIDPVAGTVKKNDKTVCRFVFLPTKQTTLENTTVTCTVAGNRNYVFNLEGTAIPPSLQFSFVSYDFGPCFLTTGDAIPLSETAMLTIFNQDPEASVDLDCLFEKKPYLRVDCPPTVLGPRETATIRIVFTARQEQSYFEILPFVINGSTTVNVTIRGEGVAPKVELANISMQTVSLGSLQIGGAVSRLIKLVNRSKRKASIELLDSDVPGVPSLEELGISIFPSRDLLLKPKESMDIEFKFVPTRRIPAFQKDILMQVAGSKRKLLVLSGSCHGMEVQLETDTLSFGTVCLGSQVSRKIHLQNHGDLNAKFQWNPKDFAPDFSISPVEGVVAPNQNKALEVTFKPMQLNADVRYERLGCVIEGGDPVFLTLTGGCVKQSASSIVDMKFEARVREETSKPIVIENKTNQPWHLFPVVQGEHWYCQENIAVPAEGKATLNLFYRPLTMTKQLGEEQDAKYARPLEHQGSVFFAIPDGTALLYNVFGKANPPISSGTLSFTTAAKKALVVPISVKNWQKQPQTFNVEFQKPQDKESFVVQGATTITVPGSATKTFNMKFYSYLEGPVSFTVRFLNPHNGELVYYDVNITVTKAEEVETLLLDAPLRQSVRKVITIENPFGRDKTIRFTDPKMWWKCSSPAIRVTQISDINGRPEGSYQIEYRPILYRPNPIEALLTISFMELGEYTYKLKLSTQEPGVERILHFNAPLGGSQTQTFGFTSYVERNTELACAVRSPASFLVPASCKVEGTADWEGKNCSLQVKFEPEALGEFSDTLVLSSDVAGEYKCTLQGVAVAPLPQGPFTFTQSKEIEFRNVFSTPKEFEVTVDNPRFVLASKVLSIPAKSSKSISIKFDPKIATASAPGVPTNTAKLFVSCPSMKELPPWVYYLEGPTTGGS